MRPGDIAIARHPLVNPREELRRARRVPPVAHELADNIKHAHHVHPGTNHLVVGNVADGRRDGAAGLNHGPDRVPLGAQGAGEEGRADVGDDAGEHDLGAVGCFDGGAEVGVVPGVDFAVALDEGGGGVPVEDFLGDGAVGAVLGGGGEDDGDVAEDGADAGVGEDALSVDDGVWGGSGGY